MFVPRNQGLPYADKTPVRDSYRHGMGYGLVRNRHRYRDRWYDECDCIGGCSGGEVMTFITTMMVRVISIGCIGQGRGVLVIVAVYLFLVRRRDLDRVLQEVIVVMVLLHHQNHQRRRRQRRNVRHRRVRRCRVPICSRSRRCGRPAPSTGLNCTEMAMVLMMLMETMGTAMAAP